MGTITDFPGNWDLPQEAEAERFPRPAEIEEDRLVDSARNGDDDAFVRIIELHQEAIFRFCCQWLKNEEDAREATQDTFVRAYLAVERYRKRGRLSTWLFQIALNQCRDRLKSKAGSQSRRTDSLLKVANGDALICPAPAPDEAVALSGDQLRLREAIEALPLRLRAVVIICGVEGMSQEICAEILNISVRAVEGRFYRARQQLEAALKES